MSVLSGISVQREISALRNAGVTVHGNPELFAPKADMGWILGKHAECSTAEIVGRRGDYRDISLNPDYSREGDVDVLIKRDLDYCIQVKSLNFFESENFGEPMTDATNWAIDTVDSTPYNTGYRGGFADSNRFEMWGIPTPTASAGILEFHPSFFGYPAIRKKLRSTLKKAASQLRSEPGRRNVVVVDARYFHAAGDQVYYDLIGNLLSTEESLGVIDYAFLLSYEFPQENGSYQARSRLIPIRSPNFNEEFDVRLFSDLRNTLYRSISFVLPVSMSVDEGWNTVLEIRKGVLYSEGVPIGRLP